MSAIHEGLPYGWIDRDITRQVDFELRLAQWLHRAAIAAIDGERIPMFRVGLLREDPER